MESETHLQIAHVTGERGLTVADAQLIIDNGNLPVETRVITANNLPKISHQTAEDEIKNFFKYAFAMIGLQTDQWPDDLEKMMLVNFARTELTHYTIQELRLAFSFAVTRKFEIDLRHFGKFSPEYLMRIVNGYDKYTSELIAEAHRRKKAAEFAEQNKIIELTPEQKLESGKKQLDFILKLAEEKNQIPLFIEWSTVFSYMESEGLIRDTKNQKQKFFEQVQKEMLKETKAKIKPGRLDHRLREEVKRIEAGEIKSECRKRRIIKWVEKKLKKKLC